MLRGDPTHTQADDPRPAPRGRTPPPAEVQGSTRLDAVLRRRALWTTICVWTAAAVLDGALVLALLVARPADRGPVQAVESAGDRPLIGPAADAPGEVRLKHLPGPPIPVVRAWPLLRSAAVPHRAPDLGDLKPALHAVNAGETLTSIARAYLGPDASWQRIAEANALEPPFVLQIGQQLVLPDVLVATMAVHVALAPARERPAEGIARAVFGTRVNPPPPGAFARLQPRLELERPLREAFRWDVPAKAMGSYCTAAVLAWLVAFSGIPGPTNVTRLAVRLSLGTCAGAGVAACLCGLAVLCAGPVSRSPELQCAFAFAAGLSCGLAAFVAARQSVDAPGRRPRTDRRFAVALGTAVTILALLAVGGGWAADGFAALQLPG